MKSEKVANDNIFYYVLPYFIAIVTYLDNNRVYKQKNYVKNLFKGLHRFKCLNPVINMYLNILVILKLVKTEHNVVYEWKIKEKEENLNTILY